MLLAQAVHKVRRPRVVERLRAEWAKPRPEPHELDDVRKLDDVLGADCSDNEYRVDPRTWPDLDMPLVYETVDRTLTPPGAQSLYRSLATPRTSPAALAQREPMCELFARDERARLAVQVELSRLATDADWNLPELLWGSLPRSPLPLSLLRLLSWSPPIAIALGFWNALFWGVAAALFSANVVIDLYLQNRLLPHLSTLAFLGRLLATARRIAALRSGDGLEAVQRDLRASLRGTSQISNKTYLLQFRDPLEIVDYLRTALLRNAISFFALRELIVSRQPALRRVYDDVAAIDVAQSVASFRAHQGTWCVPTLTSAERRIVAKNIRHPAVSAPVGNDVVVGEPRSLLVTGSNMSGKSTLLKTMGVNAILAQSIFTVAAERYDAPVVRVMSSVDVLDSLGTGKSYYFDEVESVLRLVNAAAEQPARLFVVDELFRGTNPVERVAAATEVLRYLARGHLVIASTHDLEICELVAAAYDSAHFRERVTDTGVEFDYVLRPGPCTSRSAIELLRHAGYPEELVVAAAKRARGRAGTDGDTAPQRSSGDDTD